MAKKNLAKVALSITTLDPKLARAMEPRAATPSKRLETVRALSEAGIPTAVMVAPIVPAINDSEIERILDAAKAAGAESAGYVMLRMPFEIKDLFREWLREHFPAKEKHVNSLVRSLHNGKDYDAEWGKRQTGDGPYAWSIGRRFELACERLGLNKQRSRLTVAHFKHPVIERDQLDLFAA
jgi:DNA repair photolyase